MTTNIIMKVLRHIVKPVKILVVLTFRNVITSVTVKLAHSVVRMKTADIQIYCVKVLPIR